MRKAEKKNQTAQQLELEIAYLGECAKIDAHFNLTVVEHGVLSMVCACCINTHSTVWVKKRAKHWRKVGWQGSRMEIGERDENRSNFVENQSHRVHKTYSRRIMQYLAANHTVAAAEARQSQISNRWIWRKNWPACIQNALGNQNIQYARTSNDCGAWEGLCAIQRTCEDGRENLAFCVKLTKIPHENIAWLFHSDCWMRLCRKLALGYRNRRGTKNLPNKWNWDSVSENRCR